MVAKLLHILPTLLSFIFKRPNNFSDIYPNTVSELDILRTYLLSEDFMSTLKAQVFPYTPISDISNNWPLIVEALEKQGLLNKDMVCYVLATVLVENDKFKPILERPSRYSTKSGKPPYDFSKYDTHPGLGNTKPGDGSFYRGAGFIQLTGRANYTDMDSKLGLDGGLIEHGAVAANQPNIAAAILAQYFKDREARVNPALETRNFVTLRRIVNGGTMHLGKFQDGFIKVESILSSLSF
jgi:hypothetical protein